MSQDPDRIAVPTNGRGPHPISAPAAPAARAAPPSPPETRLSGTSDEELSVAFSPKQLAIGFGIIASLLLLLAGRARRRSSH